MGYIDPKCVLVGIQCCFRFKIFTTNITNSRLRFTSGVRLEYGRVIDEINWCKAELNSWKAALNNEVRVYLDFCDRNLLLKNREDGLKLTIHNLEARETELQKTTTELKQQFIELQQNSIDNVNFEHDY